MYKFHRWNTETQNTHHALSEVVTISIINQEKCLKFMIVHIRKRNRLFSRKLSHTKKKTLSLILSKVPTDINAVSTDAPSVNLDHVLFKTEQA